MAETNGERTLERDITAPTFDVPSVGSTRNPGAYRFTELRASEQSYQHVAALKRTCIGSMPLTLNHSPFVDGWVAPRTKTMQTYRDSEWKASTCTRGTFLSRWRKKLPAQCARADAARCDVQSRRYRVCPDLYGIGSDFSSRRCCLQSEWQSRLDCQRQQVHDSSYRSGLVQGTTWLIRSRSSPLRVRLLLRSNSRSPWLV